jgi:hypothetical protein
MTIDSRIKTTSLVLVFFVLGMGVILFWNCRQIENGIEQMRMNSQIVEAAFMLRVLMDEQLTYPENAFESMAKAARRFGSNYEKQHTRMRPACHAKKLREIMKTSVYLLLNSWRGRLRNPARSTLKP